MYVDGMIRQCGHARLQLSTGSWGKSSFCLLDCQVVTGAKNGPHLENACLIPLKMLGSQLNKS